MENSESHMRNENIKSHVGEEEIQSHVGEEEIQSHVGDEKIHDKNIDHGDVVEGSDEDFLGKRIQQMRSEIEEMKWKRVEDMKANERVLGIFASKEEAWRKEKKQLTQEIDALKEIDRYNNPKNEDGQSKEQGSSELKGNAAIGDLSHKLAREIQQRKVAYSKYVAVVSELKAQKDKVENMLRTTLVEMGAWKRDAALKAKEKRHVDVALRKVTDEIMRLQKEVEDKDAVIAEMSQKGPATGVRDSLEAELRVKELELSNAKMKLQQYADGERNRDKEAEKWKRLYLGLKLELDNLQVQMYARPSNALSESGHNSAEVRRNSSSSRSTSRAEAQDLAERNHHLEREIETKNEQIDGLRYQLSNLEKEMTKKEKEAEFLRRSLSKEREDKVEAQKEAMSARQMLLSTRSKAPKIQFPARQITYPKNNNLDAILGKQSAERKDP